MIYAASGSFSISEDNFVISTGRDDSGWAVGMGGGKGIYHNCVFMDDHDDWGTRFGAQTSLRT